MTLGEAYPLEQARCRELLGEYKAIGPAGAFGVKLIEEILQRADQAAIRQDLPAMVGIFMEMKELR